MTQPIKTCHECNLPHYSASSTCPRCRILSAWHQPSPLAQELLAQMDLIVDALDQAKGELAQIKFALCHAHRNGNT